MNEEACLLYGNTFNNFNSYVGSIINQRAYTSVSCPDTTSFNPDCRWRSTGPAYCLYHPCCLLKVQKYNLKN